MIDRVRRLVAALLIPFVLIWSIMLPRQAYAFAPVGAAPIAIVGTLASGVVVPLVIGAAIAGIAYWAFKDLTTTDEVRVPAVAGAAGVIPAPTASGTASGVTLYSINDGSCSQSAQSSVGGACSSWGACKAPSFSPSANFSMRAPVGNYCSYSLNGVNYDGAASGVQAAGAFVCPAGYAGNPCTLTNARAAVDDKKQDYQRTGAAVTIYPGELPGSLSGTVMTTNSANDTIYVAGKDSLGNALQGKIIALADGGSKVELKVQKQTASGQTYVETQSYQTSSAGDVVAATQTVAAAQLSYNPTTKQYTENAAPAGTAAPDLGSGSQAVTFPTDYARQGEAATAAQSISNTLGPKLDKLVETSPAPADLTIPDPSGYTDFGTTFQSLLGWQLPGHTSQCPTAAFNTPWNTAYTIDSHCQLITNHWSALQAAMAVVWTIVALFVVLRA